MKPELQKIFTKLSEEKLEKVDLSAAKAKTLTNDFRKAENGMKSKKKVLDNLLKELKALEKLQLAAKKEYDEAIDFMEIYGQGKDRYDTIYDSLEKQAKELGIDVNEIPVMRELNKSFDDAADAYRPLAEILGDVRKAYGSPI